MSCLIGCGVTKEVGLFYVFMATKEQNKIEVYRVNIICEGERKTYDSNILVFLHT